MDFRTHKFWISDKFGLQTFTYCISKHWNVYVHTFAVVLSIIFFLKRYLSTFKKKVERFLSELINTQLFFRTFFYIQRYFSTTRKEKENCDIFIKLVRFLNKVLRILWLVLKSTILLANKLKIANHFLIFIDLNMVYSKLNFTHQPPWGGGQNWFKKIKNLYFSTFLIKTWKLLSLAPFLITKTDKI